MSKAKNYIKNISLILLSIIIYLLFISIFYYFEILNYKVVSINVLKNSYTIDIDGEEKEIVVSNEE